MYAIPPRTSSGVQPRPRSPDHPPFNFDATANPILSRHWFGLKPFSPKGHAADLRRERQIEHVYRLGVRAVGELLREVAEDDDLDRALEAYGRLTPDLLKALGGDHFPPAPLHEIPAS